MKCFRREAVREVAGRVQQVCAGWLGGLPLLLLNSEIMGSLHHGERTAVTRGRQGLLGTARDGSGRLGTARDRPGRLGTARDARDEARETENYL